MLVGSKAYQGLLCACHHRHGFSFAIALAQIALQEVDPVKENENDDQYVRFVNVKKSYDQKNLVVKDFNLDIRKGEFVTLLGPSGSGKTTCLMMLAGFEDVTSGSILIDGQPVTNIAPYHRNIGMVFQHYALFPHMTIAENLGYPLRVSQDTVCRG